MLKRNKCILFMDMLASLAPINNILIFSLAKEIFIIWGLRKRK
jgi:hypothetical protein